VVFTQEQIALFFAVISDLNLTCDIPEGVARTPAEFNVTINKFFGASMARLILCEEAIVDAPLHINGTPWEQLIAKWRMSLSQ